ncbi:metal-dependent hydrolase [uncultured Winogradskyella sp.]|uniref:metal-dependent hydrolase n=1 Tax=uncultured Winogradskyella sp. TaxID=395353 RepID=UPI0026274D3D|nr:metal-dependent hydrolase [uncultured Winogradskyella sp.]|tara:strand:+ start:1420 stop:1938 length:519 start_codon:yes stop_codon:yes gene_type:complete
MASIFGHGFVAYTVAKVIDSKSNKLLLFLAIGSAMLPDLDVLAFKLGITYEHPFGHRGFTHSIIFAILWSLLLAFAFGKSRKLIFTIVLFLATISHGLLDAMTTGGKGVGFFIPIDNSRYFFPFRPVKVSPIGIKEFFSEWGINVILSELQYIGIPCLIVLVVLSVWKKGSS